jgi:hypothetical protein
VPGLFAGSSVTGWGWIDSLADQLRHAPVAGRCYRPPSAGSASVHAGWKRLLCRIRRFLPVRRTSCRRASGLSTPVPAALLVVAPRPAAPGQSKADALRMGRSLSGRPSGLPTAAPGFAACPVHVVRSVRLR